MGSSYEPALHHLTPCHADLHAVLATEDGPKFYRVLSLAAYSVTKKTPQGDTFETKMPVGLIGYGGSAGVNGHILAADFLEEFLGYHNGSIPNPAEWEGLRIDEQELARLTASWPSWVERSAARHAELEEARQVLKQSKLIIPAGARPASIIQ